MGKIICVHHNKDLDGFASGAIVRRKFPDCELIGWDYGYPIPDLGYQNKVILIDISFPIEEMLKIADNNELIWVDHHISARKEYENCIDIRKTNIKYIYQLGIAACEIGWKHFFPDEEMPKAIKLLGEYDTWREAGTDYWNETILPFQFYMRTICTSPETFPYEVLNEFPSVLDEIIYNFIDAGKSILKYQEQQDRLNCERGAFDRIGYNGFRLLCLNQTAFSSDTMKSVYDPEKHEILVGFNYSGSFWRVSLRTLKEDIDVSQIAKANGGGGHVRAAGFEVKNFEDIFKIKSEQYV